MWSLLVKLINFIITTSFHDGNQNVSASDICRLIALLSVQGTILWANERCSDGITTRREPIHGDIKFMKLQWEFCSTIQFTMEGESEGKIWIPLSSGRRMNWWYRFTAKQLTNTDHYINFSSHHHSRILTNILCSLGDRAYNVSLTSE